MIAYAKHIQMPIYIHDRFWLYGNNTFTTGLKFCTLQILVIGLLSSIFSLWVMCTGTKGCCLWLGEPIDRILK